MLLLLQALLMMVTMMMMMLLMMPDADMDPDTDTKGADDVTVKYQRYE